MELKTKRTAREIKISNNLINNKNINVKIGTVENRNSPETIYIFISFWAKPTEKIIKESQSFLKNILEKRLNDIYKKELKNKLIDSDFFTSEKDNIYIKNIPENINYNDKRNFLSIELYLHTLNVGNNKPTPLSNKKNTQMFDEALKISNIIGDSDFLTSNKEFEIFKKSI